LFFAFFIFSAADSQKNLTCGRIKVSDNGHFLVNEDGAPFFWLGDTGWELFHRLNRNEALSYMKKRKEQGFNVIR
jgi:hypothetical protein